MDASSAAPPAPPALPPELGEWLEGLAEEQAAALFEEAIFEYRPHVFQNLGPARDQLLTCYVTRQ